MDTRRGALTPTHQVERVSGLVRRSRARRQLARDSGVASTSTATSATSSGSIDSLSTSTASGSTAAASVSLSLESPSTLSTRSRRPAPSSSAVPTSTRLQHVAQPPPSPSHAAPVDTDRSPTLSSSSSSSSSSFDHGPIYTPLILAPDLDSPTTPMSSPPDAQDSPAAAKRSMGGLSMGLGVLIGALVILAVLVPAFFLFRHVRAKRRQRTWMRNRRLTHIDPGAGVGEHIGPEKIPVSPFVWGAAARGQGGWGGSERTRASVMHISSAGIVEDEQDEEAGRTPRSGTTPTSADLLVPVQSPGSGGVPSPGSGQSSIRGRPAALELARARSATGPAAVRQSTPDGAVEFTLGVQPPSEPSAALSHSASSTLPAVPSTSALPAQQPAKRSSIEKPAGRLVAHNALTPPPPTTPLRTPAPRYSRQGTTASLWQRLSGVVPPAYESPRPTQTQHLQVPGARHQNEEAWAPLRVPRRQATRPPQLPKPSFDGGGRI